MNNADQTNTVTNDGPLFSIGLRCILLACVSLILIASRLHSFHLPLEADECNYIYIGTRLITGDRLYVDVWDHQPPGVFVLFAGISGLFGQSDQVYRWVGIVASIMTGLIMYKLLRLMASPLWAIIAALIWALVSADPGTAGDGINREVFMNPLILGAWWIVLRHLKRICDNPQQQPTIYRSLASPLLAGLLLGLASWLKTIVAIHWLGLALILIMAYMLLNPQGLSVTTRMRRSLLIIIAFGAMPFCLWAATSAYFYATGRWSEYLDAVFLFNMQYASGSSLPTRLLSFFHPPKPPVRFDSAFPLWGCGIAAALWLAARTISTAMLRTTTPAPFMLIFRVALLVLIITNAVAIVMPGHDWPHYYYLMLPMLVVASIVFLADLYCIFGSVAYVCWPTARNIPMAAAVVLVAVCAGWQYRHYYSQRGFDITQARYNGRDYWGQAMGQKIQAVTDPQDTVYIFSSDAGIYHYSQRRCATRFTMITGLQSRYGHNKDKRRLFMDDLRSTMPRVILVLMDEPPFPEWLAFLKEHYTAEPIGWDFNDRTGDPIMFVLDRRDAPVAKMDWEWHWSEAEQTNQAATTK